MKIISAVVVLWLLACAPVFAGMPAWQWLNGPYVGRAVDITIGSGGGQKILYAANENASLFRSTDEGSNWLPTSMGSPTCVTTAPQNPQIAYTGGSWKVYKTNDGGVNWVFKSAGIGAVSPLCLAVDPSEPNATFVLLGSASQGGSSILYRTFTGGDAWEPRNVSTNQMDVFDIAVVPSPTRKLFLAGGNGTDGGFYLSVDDGSNWQRRLVADVRAVAYDATNPLNVWEGEVVSGQAGVRKSTDGGASWPPLTTILPKGTCITSLAVTAPNRVYASTDEGMFLSIDGGQNWTEINNGIYMRHIRSIAVDPSYVQNLYLGGRISIYRSSDGGQNWNERVQGMELPDVMGVSASLPDANYVLGVETVHKNINGGQAWLTIDDESTVYGSRYGIVASPTEPLEAFYSFENIFENNNIRRTMDGGHSWVNLFDPPVWATYTSVAVDPCDGRIVYEAFRGSSIWPGIFKSTDRGNSWSSVCPTAQDVLSLSIDLWSPSTVFAGGSDSPARIYRTTNGGANWNTIYLPQNGGVQDICSNSPINTVYARVNDSSSGHGVYKSTNGGDVWFGCGLQGYTLSALAMDHSEPEILYAATEAPDKTLLTVDGGKEWTEINSPLPSHAEDLALDVYHPVSVYAGTTHGLYSLTPTWQFKSLTSASSSASDSNSQRKLVRQEGTSNLHAVYHSGSSTTHNVYYTTSTDGGATWSRKILLGQGSFPAIALDEGGNPQVIWLSDSDNALRYAYRQGGVWSAGQTLYTASASDKIGPPAFCAVHSVAGSRGHVVFNWKSGTGSSTAVKYGWFTLNASGTLQNVVNVDSGNNSSSFCSRPSLASSLSLGSYYLHASWAKGTNVWYSYKQLDSGPWTNTKISQNNTINAQPNIEFYGDAVNVAWVQTSSSPVSVINRYRSFPYGSWSTWKTVSQAAGCSSPQMASGVYCVWNEGDNEIYYAYRVGGVWQTKINLSNTPERSVSPQVAFLPGMMGTTLFCFWTENNSAPYQEYFTTTMGPLSGFFTLDAGQTDPSPYTVHRGGYLQYTQEPEKTVDTDGSYLTYRFDRLDPKMLYLVRASYYQESGSPVGLEVKVNGSVFANLAVPNRSVIKGEAWVPSELYSDSVVEITIRKKSGTLGTLGYLELCQAEPKGKGGPQSSGLADLSLPREFSLDSGYPNPMTSEGRIDYALPKASSVDLTVYNISGQVVRRLVSEPSKAPGRYSVRWDGRNKNGHRVPGGVYFYRLNAGNFSETRKFIVVR
jgi:photosystem II stability/assembly factor-like uncharacterized protein